MQASRKVEDSKRVDRANKFKISKVCQHSFEFRTNSRMASKFLSIALVTMLALAALAPSSEAARFQSERTALQLAPRQPSMVERQESFKLSPLRITYQYSVKTKLRDLSSSMVFKLVIS